MATGIQNTAQWVVMLRDGRTFTVQASTWELLADDEMYSFTNGGNSCAAVFAQREVAAIYDASAVSS